MKHSFRLALAQFDYTVGAVAANAARIAEDIAAARDRHGADLVAFPELALCGYTPEDLLLRPGFVQACDAALQGLAAGCHAVDALVGHPGRAMAPESAQSRSADEPTLANRVSLLRDGAVQASYAKRALPDYGVFDERRYFAPGHEPCVVEVHGVHVGLLICEDVWTEAPVAAACAAGAEMLLVVNASPFDRHKRSERREMLQRQARAHGVGIAYLNLVGGQDELLFDGGSLLVDGDGNVAAEAPAFVDLLLPADYDAATRRFRAIDWPASADDDSATIYTGLVRGIRDYVDKNGFPGILLGLSGGIDSALTLALAVDALGAARVTAVMLPSRYTSQLSLDGARAQADRLGVAYHVLPIEESFENMLHTLGPAFAGKPADLAEENLQARIRGAMLMALSNKHGRLLLTTGNKSEMAVGYATLYGDMCGGYAPLKDVYKTVVYRLARWRNEVAGLGTRDSGLARAGAPNDMGVSPRSPILESRIPASPSPESRVPSPVIPWEVIDRAPSAELRHEQTDQDTLPPYEVLDAILDRFIEGGQSQAEIAAAGFDIALVRRVVRLVLANEFKRRQAAPGPKVTRRAFGRDRRYPITSAWR